MTYVPPPPGRSPYTAGSTTSGQSGLQYPPIYQPYEAAPAQETATQMWHGDSAPRMQARNTGLALLGLLAALGLLAVLFLVLRQGDVAATTASFLMALIPLSIVLGAVIWLDRWEPEPWPLLLFALLWGAGMSTFASLQANTVFAEWVLQVTGDPARASTLAAIIAAPVVEEFTKGLGVLVIFLLGRRYFDGPVDGVVYAATVAAGFAFTENILYFTGTYDTVWLTFVVRGLMSPFAHLLFTAAIGIALGIASRSRSKLAWLPAFLMGWVVAMILHALWNWSGSLGDRFFVLYLTVQVPLFLGTILLLAWLRRQERKVIETRLTEYAHAGWFAPHEVTMLSSLPLRAQARRWARTHGPRAAAVMKRFQRHATALAFGKHREMTGRLELRSHFDEQLLLHALIDDRESFRAHAQGRVDANPSRTAP